MASAQAMEEELQQSVILSEDAEYDTTDTNMRDPPASAGRVKRSSKTRVSHESDSEDEEDLSDQDASGEDVDQDASGEEDNDLLGQQIVVGKPSRNDEPAEYDEDAEGDEDLDEGVGAVKVRPEESQDEEHMESEASDMQSAAEEESEDDEVPWEEADGGDEDEESEAAQSNACMFCKQDEESDPSEDFEAFLACRGCGENAHQQCARDAVAMSEDNSAKRWKCPECANAESASEGESSDDADSDEIDAPAAPRSHRPKLAGDVIPAQLVNTSADDRSAIDELALDEYPRDGSWHSRKRKSSSAEPEDAIVAIRKRRRNMSTDLTDADNTTRDSRSAEPTRGPSSRTSRLKVARPPPVTVEKRSRTSLVLKIEVRPGNLKEILSRRKRDRRRGGSGGGGGGGGSSSIARPQPPRSTPGRPSAIPAALISTMPTPFTSESYSQPFYSFFDKETDEMKGRPYGGILSEVEADTSKTLPSQDDRKKFDQAKQKAEDEWRARVLALQAEADLPIRRPKKTSDNASQIECIEFGGWEIDTWYAAPYPAEYSRNRVLYICEFCLKYMNSDYVAWRHKLKCGTKHPPGDEIYRHESISIFEVDGRKHPVYCQNLCLLAKLFLGSKTLYYDVEPFLFYVLCEFDETGYHFVGYFSKEKRASSQNNVSCILTLPIHQRKGYGNLLIDFSYLLTKVEEKTGSPEKPLSDMGLVSYRNYWRLELCRYFLDYTDGERCKQDGLSIKKISDDTGMTADDVVSALEGLRALVRDPQTHLYAFRVDLDYCRHYVAKWESKGYVKLKPAALAWTPYVMGRSNVVNFELGPPMNTIAPREDDEAKLSEGPNAIVAGPNGTGEEPKPTSADQVGVNKVSDPLISIEKSSSDDKENAEPQDEAMDEADNGDVESLAVAYKDIPPSRFEIFPPVPGSRRNDRVRQSISRPSAPRTGSSSSSRPKKPSGSSRRPTASRPRSNSSRRKSGGTGRGPGRWPKGTKKSDYGNADSGPGLPPGWRETQGRQTGGTDTGSFESTDEKPAEDEVRVLVATAGNQGNAVNGSSAVSGSGSTSESEGESGDEGSSDEEEDVDAEGEDE